jgi:hypothetical protein
MEWAVTACAGTITQHRMPRAWLSLCMDRWADLQLYLHVEQLFHAEQLLLRTVQSFLKQCMTQPRTNSVSRGLALNDTTAPTANSKQVSISQDGVPSRHSSLCNLS